MDNSTLFALGIIGLVGYYFYTQEQERKLREFRQGIKSVDENVKDVPVKTIDVSNSSVREGQPPARPKNPNPNYGID